MGLVGSADASIVIRRYLAPQDGQRNRPDLFMELIMPAPFDASNDLSPT